MSFGETLEDPVISTALRNTYNIDSLVTGTIKFSRLNGTDYMKSIDVNTYEAIIPTHLENNEIVGYKCEKLFYDYLPAFNDDTIFTFKVVLSGTLRVLTMINFKN